MNDASANGINDGTECAVSEAERIDNLLEMARQVQTDVRPSQYTPLKRACVEIDRLRDDLDFHKKIRAAQEGMIDKLHIEWLEQRDTIDYLRRPWWVKLLTWATA